jgi:xanthine dehydrogenase accessory factor
MTPEAATREAALRWISEGRRFVAAVLVEVLGSAPLDPGATMLVDEHGAIEGSVTGGCVEGALVAEARRVLAGGEPAVHTYGISDELAGDVGLMCGGTVRILVSEVGDGVAPVLTAALAAAAQERPVAIATLLDGPGAGRRMALVDGEPVGTFGVTDLLDHSVARDAAGLLARGSTLIRRYGADGSTMGDDLRVHILSFAPPPRMIVFGAIDFSAAVARLARDVGYRVTICDARRPFLESKRFAEAHEVVVDWPDRYLEGVRLSERDAVLVFTHDPKLDVPAVQAALATDAGYIGALGSRRTTSDRNRRLRDVGVTDEQIARVFAPCGLDIGASTVEETAVSVLAEIVTTRAGRHGRPLREAEGPIRHAETVAQHA